MWFSFQTTDRTILWCYTNAGFVKTHCSLKGSHTNKIQSFTQPVWPHIYIYAFTKCFCPKQLTLHFISSCFSWESNPWHRYASLLNIQEGFIYLLQEIMLYISFNYFIFLTVFVHFVCAKMKRKKLQTND